MTTATLNQLISKIRETLPQLDESSETETVRQHFNVGALPAPPLQSAEHDRPPARPAAEPQRRGQVRIRRSGVVISFRILFTCDNTVSIDNNKNQLPATLVTLPHTRHVRAISDSLVREYELTIRYNTFTAI